MVQGTTNLRRDSVTGSHMSIASTATSISGTVVGDRRPSVAGSVFGGSSLSGSRRSSLVGGMPPKRSFLNISKAVGKTALLKKMFSSGKQDDLGAVDQLPKSPRFSATLSAEAQFAMMKGYEDILITTLGEKYPEHAPEFKRCTTPTRHIELNEMSDEKKKSMTTLFRANRIDSSKSDSAALVETGRLPALPSKKKQLVLTHRFNCAMDILDAVKANQGSMVISPRIMKEKQRSDPVSQYSTWSRVWTREFKL